MFHTYARPQHSEFRSQTPHLPPRSLSALARQTSPYEPRPKAWVHTKPRENAAKSDGIQDPSVLLLFIGPIGAKTKATAPGWSKGVDRSSVWKRLKAIQGLCLEPHTFNVVTLLTLYVAARSVDSLNSPSHPCLNKETMGPLKGGGTPWP